MENIYSKEQDAKLETVLAVIANLPKKETSKVNGDCEKMKLYINEVSVKVRNEFT